MAVLYNPKLTYACDTDESKKIGRDKSGNPNSVADHKTLVSILENLEGLNGIEFVGEADGAKHERIAITSIGYGMLTGKVEAPPGRLYPKEDLDKIWGIIENLKRLDDTRHPYGMDEIGADLEIAEINYDASIESLKVAIGSDIVDTQKMALRQLRDIYDGDNRFIPKEVHPMLKGQIDSLRKWVEETPGQGP